MAAENSFDIENAGKQVHAALSESTHAHYNQLIAAETDAEKKRQLANIAILEEMNLYSELGNQLTSKYIQDLQNIQGLTAAQVVAAREALIQKAQWESFEAAQAVVEEKKASLAHYIAEEHAHEGAAFNAKATVEKLDAKFKRNAKIRFAFKIVFGILGVLAGIIFATAFLSSVFGSTMLSLEAKILIGALLGYPSVWIESYVCGRVMPMLWDSFLRDGFLFFPPLPSNYDEYLCLQEKKRGFVRGKFSPEFIINQATNAKELKLVNGKPVYKMGLYRYGKLVNGDIVKEPLHEMILRQLWNAVCLACLLLNATGTFVFVLIAFGGLMGLLNPVTALPAAMWAIPALFSAIMALASVSFNYNRWSNYFIKPPMVAVDPVTKAPLEQVPNKPLSERTRDFFRSLFSKRSIPIVIGMIMGGVAAAVVVLSIPGLGPALAGALGPAAAGQFATIIFGVVCGPYFVTQMGAYSGAMDDYAGYNRSADPVDRKLTTMEMKKLPWMARKLYLLKMWYQASVLQQLANALAEPFLACKGMCKSFTTTLGIWTMLQLGGLAINPMFFVGSVISFVALQLVVAAIGTQLTKSQREILHTAAAVVGILVPMIAFSILSSGAVPAAMIAMMVIMAIIDGIGLYFSYRPDYKEHAVNYLNAKWDWTKENLFGIEPEVTLDATNKAANDADEFEDKGNDIVSDSKPNYFAKRPTWGDEPEVPAAATDLVNDIVSKRRMTLAPAA